MIYSSPRYFIILALLSMSCIYATGRLTPNQTLASKIFGNTQDADTRLEQLHQNFKEDNIQFNKQGLYVGQPFTIGEKTFNSSKEINCTSKEKWSIALFGTVDNFQANIGEWLSSGKVSFFSQSIHISEDFSIADNKITFKKEERLVIGISPEESFILQVFHDINTKDAYEARIVVSNILQNLHKAGGYFTCSKQAYTDHILTLNNSITISGMTTVLGTIQLDHIRTDRLLELYPNLIRDLQAQRFDMKHWAPWHNPKATLASGLITLVACYIHHHYTKQKKYPKGKRKLRKKDLSAHKLH